MSRIILIAGMNVEKTTQVPVRTQTTDLSVAEQESLTLY